MPNFPPGTHEYDPERHSLIEGVSKFMIRREEARAKFHEYHNALGPHDEVYTDGSKINERVGAAAVINRQFQNGETTCRQLSKTLPNNSIIFSAETTAITLALDYYRYMDPVKHDVVVYSDSMSCLQAIEGDDTENPLICHTMNLFWALSDKGTRVCFCWVPSHCGIEGNQIMDQLAKETLDHDIDPLATVHYADLKPVVNSYIQQEVQIKWDVSIHGRDLYLSKPTLGPPKKFKHLTRAEEVVITRLRIGHTKATKSHIMSRGPPTACQHCDQTLTIEHMLLECTVLQQIRDEYYTTDSLRTLFETISKTCIVEFLREAGFFYLIWKAIYPVQHIRIIHQLKKFGIYINHHILTPLNSCILFIEHKQLRKPYLWKTANMSLRTCVVVKQMQSNPKPSNELKIVGRALAVMFTTLLWDCNFHTATEQLNMVSTYAIRGFNTFWETSTPQENAELDRAKVVVNGKISSEGHSSYFVYYQVVSNKIDIIPIWNYILFLTIQIHTLRLNHIRNIYKDCSCI